jgi:hypothetical protein
LTTSGLAATISARATKGATVMSELDVIVIHIRAEQAAEYERLFAERELPRWREYEERGRLHQRPDIRAAFVTDPRQDIAKYVMPIRDGIACRIGMPDLMRDPCRSPRAHR